VIVEGSARIIGSPEAIEGHLDAREIDRRLADPENQRRI
jgi:hypothetical protein